MKIRKLLLSLGVFLMTPAFCHAENNDISNVINNDINFSTRQYSLMLQQIGREGKVRIPKTIDKLGRMVYIPIDDWCSGFFPGSLCYLYQLTNDKSWLLQSRRFTEALDSIQYLTWHHDVGFMIGSSYLNIYRLSPNKAYKKAIIQTAKSLCTRFRKKAGVIQSWNVDRGWQSKRGWTCPVIIDNMMNLELLFEATRLSGDSTYWKVAVSHANKTLENQFRKDGSCYHVVDYDPNNGAVLHRQTAQGYADNSAWARGQAWAVYGYTVCYRYTHDRKYLDQAVKTLNFVMQNPNLPEDLIPYWDFDAPNIPNEPRDVSSAACIASALYEMNNYLPDNGYTSLADRIIRSLSSPEYRAPLGKNGCFLLMHSVGSIPHNNEIDVPLNYADYYFLEALTRRK
ncbi:glycoside hydrolase family 88 protein [Segatella salivae]|jgi:unsaturated glucuronylhydrolase|uniref:glycoside hydrolase family 88 protein n=1 Tax=Segatella salivae TaxID=228604 RepID=UPI001CAD3DF3|nr:glycoside hydrolase family 88 protein [Segatella salivae]MBF1540074.1 glycoside hydrolase family 88 protein [Segatella salivae]MBF1560687.1 glycoside hydrolase family 88 protein [Segatella salivae]MBF1574361.1 glycoside hydrolase family 88 protein [Segatella salivae]